MTLEHVWPQWVRETLYANATSFDHEVKLRDEEPRIWPAIGIDVQVKTVCSGCNSGWMAELEGRAKKILVPMAEGQYRVLQGIELELLALWALKTALMFKCVDRASEGFNPVHHASLYQHLPGAPPNAYVWLGRFDPDDKRDFYRSRDIYPSTTGVQGQAPLHLGAFTLREIVFLVGVSADPARGLEVESKYLRPVLPSEGFVRWPMRRVLDASTFPALTDGLPEADGPGVSTSVEPSQTDEQDDGS